MEYVRFFKFNDFKEAEFPFEVKFSFKKIFDFWEEQTQSEEEDVANKATALLQRMQAAPELMAPFQDLSIVEKYQKEVEHLLEPLFPKMLGDNEIKAACMPFSPYLFNVTPRFQRIIDNAGGDHKIGMHQADIKQQYIFACVFVLNYLYGAGINYREPTYFDVPDTNADITRHYRAFFNADFSAFTVNENFTPLTVEEIKELTDNFDNYELWKEKMPPGSFVFEGFAIVNLFDVTIEEAVSNLKVDLLKKDALYTPEVVEQIRLNLASMLNLNGLKLGFIAFDEDRKMLKSLGYGFWNSILLADKHLQRQDETFCDYSQMQLFEKRSILAISKVPVERAEENPLVAKLVEQKLNSYLGVPLIYNDVLVGILELGSEIPNALNSVIASQLDKVISLFTTALKRSMDELETQLEAIIQAKCTAIHSSVSWRFFEAAENLLKKQLFYDTDVMEEIVFENVVPLYGQSDIKGSSTERNKSIESDLIKQLGMADEVLEAAKQKTALPVFDSLSYRIHEYIDRTKKGLGAGDELKALEFLKKEIYPVFDHISELDLSLREAVEAYKSVLDPDLGVIYDQRKDYEDSVTSINMTISGLLEKAQAEAQAMFPHYFEKYKTDGVEHNIYIGQSLVNGKTYNKMYLHNLRLWQLMTLCEIESAVRHLKPDLKVPMDICSLILIHGNPMSIRFRQDEKQFDVDGAYNVRYEIVKKRIDKAYVKGTTDRLTIPDHIAIVYSHDQEAMEYQQYFDYLRSINYIKDEVELVDLQDMQGVTGLKALRIAVNYDLIPLSQGQKDETLSVTEKVA